MPVCPQAEETPMTDTQSADFTPPPNPPCRLCGGDMVLQASHVAVARVLDVFRCTRCGVEYPVAKKKD
jgi:hypothetical protein